MMGWQTITPCKGGAYIGMRVKLSATPWQLVKLACKVAMHGCNTFIRSLDMVYVFDYKQPSEHLASGVQRILVEDTGAIVVSYRKKPYVEYVMLAAIKPKTLLWVAYRSWRLN
jgi:hypothetical protein